jgi:ABC-type Fe3+-hydroxamate transport system substrate-binding protein
VSIKFIAVALGLAFAWAFVATGEMATLVDRFQRPPVRPSAQLIRVLKETPQYRLVKHSLGETRVPLAPRRIVSLASSATDGLVALGLVPVLTTTSWKDESVTPYLDQRLRDVPKIRLAETINLETVVAAKPDLIFAGGARDARLYSQLSKIAPTVCITSNTSGDRQNRLLDVGTVLGKSAQARARLDEFGERLAAARETVVREAAGRPAAFLRFRRNTCVIYTRTAMFGPLLFDELGLVPDPAMPEVMSGGGWDVLSVERLSMLQSEYLFVVVDRDSEVYLHRVMDTPIWRCIPAVRHGHVRQVASGTWLSGDGVLGCEAIIDDVLAAVTSKRSSDERK